MTTPIPTYLRDADGFCYAYTEALSTLAGLTPWDGDVDENGFAVTEKKVAKSQPAATAKRKGATEAKVESEPSTEPEVPATAPESQE